MYALAIHRDDGKTRGRAAARPCMGCRPAPIDHHQVSSARNSSHAPTGRRIAVGRFHSSTGEALEFEALRRAGLSVQVALANLSQPVARLAVQAFAELPEVHVVRLSTSVTSNDLEATDGENGRVPNHRGKLPDQRGELPNVGDC